MTLYCEKDGNGADEVAPTGSCERFIAKPHSDSGLCNCGNCTGAIELQDEDDDDEFPILKCPNCGFTTRSVFSFREHYENDPTGDCDDVHY